MSRPATPSLLLLAAVLALAPRVYAQAAPADSATAPMPPVRVPAPSQPLAPAPGTSATPTAPATPEPNMPAPLPPPTAVPAAPPPAPVTPGSVLGTNSPTPSRPHLVAARAEGTVRGERDQMAQMVSAADSDLLDAKKKQVEARGLVEIKKREIDTINARVKAARQAKDDATRTAFEAERKRQDSMREFFNKALDVADAAIDEAQARGDWARAAVRADDFEVQLSGRAGVASLDADPGLFKLEQQYIDAVQKRGAAQEKLANKVQALAGKQLNLYRGWADYLSGK
jgi:hypothetical protein